MRTLLPIAILLCSSAVVGQTLELEKAYLNRTLSDVAVSDKDMSKEAQVRLREMGTAWNQLLKDFGGYPELPYTEESGHIEFTSIIEAPGMNKEEIFDRVIEYSAIAYGAIDAVLHYASEDKSKMILKGRCEIPYESLKTNFWGTPNGVEVNKADCLFTSVYTFKDGKVKVQYASIAYASTYYNTTEGKYVDHNISIDQYYPVAAGEQEHWRARMSTLRETDRTLTKTTQLLESYIKSRDEDFGF